MASLLPTSRVSSVDFPAFGRPTSETNPNFILKKLHHGGHEKERRSHGPFVGRLGHFPPGDPDLVDSPAVGSDSPSSPSRISPTISSSRSSAVTMPAVPPYSSTTIAHCCCCR